MDTADIRFLFEYDRWATRRILAVIDGIPAGTWGAVGVVGDRGLGSILVHQLGAHMRWRHGLSGSDLEPAPEREPLPTPRALIDSWAAEWEALDAWLATVTDDWLVERDENIPYWRMLAHLVNHGTQHRSEAAVLLTGAGRPPGDLDMIDFADERAAADG